MVPVGKGLHGVQGVLLTVDKPIYGVALDTDPGPSWIAPGDGDVLCKCGQPGADRLCPYDYEVHDKDTPCTCCNACHTACKDDS